MRYGIADAIGKVTTLFSSAIVQLPDEAGADVRKAIADAIRETVSVIGGLADIVACEANADVRVRIAGALRKSAEIFSTAIAKLPNAKNTNVGAAIIEVAKSKVVIVEGPTEQAAKGNDVDMKDSIEYVIYGARTFHEECIAPLLDAVDAATSLAIIEEF